MEYDENLQIQKLHEVLKTLDGQMTELCEDNKKGHVLGLRSIRFSVKLKKRKAHNDVIMALSHVPGILFIMEV